MTSSNRNIFCVTGLLCGEFTGNQWIPRTKASDAEVWCFLWSAPEPTVEQIRETPAIWDAIALIMTSLWWTYIISILLCSCACDDCWNLIECDQITWIWNWRIVSISTHVYAVYIDGLVQERRNEAMELRLSCINPPTCCCSFHIIGFTAISNHLNFIFTSHWKLT